MVGFCFFLQVLVYHELAHVHVHVQVHALIEASNIYFQNTRGWV